MAVYGIEIEAPVQNWAAAIVPVVMVLDTVPTHTYKEALWPTPHTLTGCTEILPHQLVFGAVMVIELDVVDAEVTIAPGGKVQIYDVALATVLIEKVLPV